MTTMELNAELFRQLSIIAEDESLMRKAVKAVTRLAKQKETEETEYIGKEEILKGIFSMNYKIIVKPSFEREAKWLAKHYASFKKDYAALLDELERNPTAGTDLGGGLRKIRMRIASKGKGKSGGARVITFTVVVAVEETEINLLYIYDKAERESVSAHEIEALLRKNGL